MENKYRYFLHLAYNGKRYFGWQIQKQGLTVQEVVNEGLSIIFREKVNVVGCGRTDTGVHARDFYANFDLGRSLSQKEISKSVKKLNGFYPVDIVIFNIIPVKPDANARFDATSRTYKYFILQKKDPFLQDLAYLFYTYLDIEKMQTATKNLYEFVDFTSFSKVNTQVKTNNCKIIEANWSIEDKMLVFTITADRFLRNMVRAIVGTFLDIGRDKINESQFRQIIESKNRSNAGYSVPAHGLFLHEVKYPEGIFVKW